MGDSSIQSYRDLRVWQEAMALAERTYHLTQDFPPAELYGMTGQIRRAATSVPANIAEGYGRESRKEYVRYLQIAQGSLKELETHLLLANRVGLTADGNCALCMEQCEKVGRMLRALIRALQR